MNPEDFEQRLARQPLRPVPFEWREQMLSPGNAAEPVQVLASLWERLFGPNPLAWAGLAAVWLVLFVVNRSGIEPTSSASIASRASQPSEAAVAEIVRERRREMAELLNLDEPRATLPARNALPPKRSQRREDFAIV